MQDVFDMRDDKLFKAVSGLAGGVGLMEDSCGSLLGASMMLGLIYGREREEIDNYDKLISSSVPVGRLYKWFEKEFGSAICHNVRTRFGGGAYYDFEIDWQREIAEEEHIFEKCSELCGKTAARAAEMIWDAIEAEKKK